MAASATPVPGMTLGQILDRIFRLLWKHLRSFAGLAILPCGAMAVCFVLLAGALLLSGAASLPPHTVMPPAMTAWILGAVVAGTVVIVGAYTLFEGAVTAAALQADAEVSIDGKAVYALARSRFGRLLGLVILRAAIVTLPMLIPFVLISGLAEIAVHSGRGAIAPGIWFLLLPLLILVSAAAIVYAILMSLRLALSPAACIAEDVRAVAALKRSHALTAGAGGRIFLVLLVVYAAGYLVIMMVELAAGALIAMGALLAAMLHIHFVSPWNILGISALTVCGLTVLFVWMAAVWSSYAVAFAVLYHDQLLRLENRAA